MAALRRTVLSLAHSAKKTGTFSTTAGKQPDLKASRAVKAVAALGTCVTAAGCYFYYNRWSEEGRRRAGPALTDTGLLPSVSAADQPRTPRLVDGEVYMSSYENRFRLFSSIEYDGQLFMTPLNFIESVTLNQPKSESKGWRSLSKKELDKILSETPPICKGSSNLFRNLRERGVISYTEYLFLICILTTVKRRKTEQTAATGDHNTLQLYGHRKPLQNAVLVKGSGHEEDRGMWDALRRSTSQVLFSDLTETTLLVHFFGKKGKAELKFEDFYKFMDNLQTEMLEVEFLAFSKGMPTISEEDFARILLRYTNVDDVSSYLDNVRSSMPDEKGITFEEFRSFFQFLNNLEDFTIAMQMYNFANRSIGQAGSNQNLAWQSHWLVTVETMLTLHMMKFVDTYDYVLCLLLRGVHSSRLRGHRSHLTRHLVNTVFKIFDVDHDDKLSYKEFLGVMKDRLQRGEGVKFHVLVHASDASSV
ncbi:hypothetical protein WMY93_020340 [Mugilogobius chulae]|uniref:EF-hand domain-containing protein n=1 Tax=Mugilogobius chulae TaxID=88201 RepID=A0AAW0NRS3_9GOBI